jgi:hypothetical protein
MKRLTKADRKKIIEETAIKYLDGEELISIIKRLEIDMMVIMKCKALKIPVEVITRHIRTKINVLVDSRVTDNFIDFRMVIKLQLGTKKLLTARKLYNVDETHNQAGLIEESIHLYI